MAWPASVRNARPVAASQSLIVLSSAPLASSLPSGLKAIALTGPECPASWRVCPPGRVSQTELPAALAEPFPLGFAARPELNHFDSGIAPARSAVETAERSSRPLATSHTLTSCSGSP